MVDVAKKLKILNEYKNASGYWKKQCWKLVETGGGYDSEVRGIDHYLEFLGRHEMQAIEALELRNRPLSLQLMVLAVGYCLFKIDEHEGMKH